MAIKDPPIIKVLESYMGVLEASMKKKARDLQTRSERLLKARIQMHKTKPSPRLDENPPVPEQLKKIRAETARLKAKHGKK